MLAHNAHAWWRPHICEPQVSIAMLRAGTFSTRLFVWLDEKAGTVFFKLAKPGLMKAFEGKWTIRGCDRTQPLASLMAAQGQPGHGWPQRQQQQQQLQQQQQPGFQDIGAQWAKGAASFATNLRGGALRRRPGSTCLAKRLSP